MILQLAAAMFGTIAFSILFGVPSRYYLYCGLIGSAGWGVFLIASDRFGAGGAAMAATMVVMFLSRLAAVYKRCPVTIFLIAGIFPLVPGAGIYWTAYYIVMDQLELAAETGYMAVKVAVAIVLGIVLIYELPQGLFIRLVGQSVKKSRTGGRG